MAEGLSEFQSSEESGEVASVASVDKGKSDEEVHVHLLPQDCSIATGDDTGTYIEQLQEPDHEILASLNGGQEHERLVHSTSSPASDDNNRHVIPECYDELVQHVTPSRHHTCQEVIEAQQEKFQLESELGRRLFLEDKQKRNEKVYQSFEARANEQIKSCSASGAAYDFTGIEGNSLGGAGLLQEPRSQSPNGQKMLDRIPPRDYNLDLLSERQGGCSDSVAGVHMQSNEGGHGVSGTNKADSGSNMSFGISDNCGSGMAVLPMNAVCDDSQRQSTDKWMRFGARPKTRLVKRTPRDLSLVESLAQGLPDAVHVPVGSSLGIHQEFLVRHSRDRSLLESLRHSSLENELTSDVSLPGASYMESMMNCIQADRIKPHTVDEVASRPDEHNRFSLPLFMRQDERGYAVGSSTFEESFNGTTGPDFTQNSDHLPSGSMGNMAHIAAAAGRSKGALNGVLSEAESTAVQPYAPGNASGACSLLNPAGDQVAVVSEPCGANSRESMSDRNTVTDCNGINTALLVLAQRIQAVCVASGERQIEEEQHREARVRAWNSNRQFQGEAEDYIMESLDSTPNSARAQARREAVITASTEAMMRGPSSCSGPVEHSCVCQENVGRRACRVHGTIVPETCRPDLAHDKCCKCLQHVFSGSLMLPCSHRVHRECLVSMIRNNELCCPICCFAFLQSG